MTPLRQQLGSAVGAALSSLCGDGEADPHIVPASRPEFGDYQANGVMAAAKRAGRDPRELARRLVERLEGRTDGLIDRLEVAGPGFVNIHLADAALLERANAALAEPERLIPKTASPQTVAVDYSSPNLAKEMHVGHLRGTIIGDCLVRVLERQGHRVIRQNHVGDWGTQFGMLLTHMLDAEDGAGGAARRLTDLEEFYKAAKERFDSDAAFADAARRNVVRLQGGDPEFKRAWELFIEESLRHCDALYRRLNVTLRREDLDAESRYNDDLAGIVDALREKSLLAESDGALCVFLPEFTGKDGGPLPLIVRKSDGGYLYSTTDLAAVRLRSFEMGADRSLYVVDVRQSLHFRQVFAVAKAAGLASERISLEHVAYGTVMGADGRPLKTRSGDAVKLSDLLDEAERRAHALVTEKSPKLAEERRREIGRAVGVAAIKYADLSKNRTSDYAFDWSAMLSLDGNTAPYLLYACARINSVLRKRRDGDGAGAIGALSSPEERALLLKALQLPEAVELVARECYPSQLCGYLYELAGLLMRFYEACPILKAEKPVREARLALLTLTAHALRQGLDLLGIEALDRM